MSNIEHHALLAYSSQQMYSLVNNVTAYPEFLPWCTAAHVLNESETEMTATLTVQKGKLEKMFTTLNVLVPYESITMHLVDGPFSHMQGFWQFKALNDAACKVSFRLDFVFNNKLLALALTPLFTKIADTMIGAFQQRAQHIYGMNNAG